MHDRHSQIWMPAMQMSSRVRAQIGGQSVEPKREQVGELLLITRLSRKEEGVSEAGMGKASCQAQGKAWYSVL